ncbi:MAG: radical SAM protein, partial [Actinomycetota bacterium]|nr:radical SAM protein [Actinomycetota bacterium]
MTLIAMAGVRHRRRVEVGRMDLASIMALRPIAGAGLLATLTRRCPLSCAHCSTASTMTSEEVDGDRLLRFVTSLATGDAPQVVMFTGGEPLLRPALLADLAAAARAAGTATAVLTGGFFTRGGRIPDRILDVLLGLEHVSFSLDAFHEREVERTAVFAALRTLLGHGKDVSLHVIGTGSTDLYLTDVTADVRRQFGTAVPMLVSQLRSVGRASAWSSGRLSTLDDRPRPCSMAAWPVIAFDGAIIACCNQKVVDARPVPEHLLLGHLDHDDWPAVRARLADSPVLRTIRTVGPLHLLARFEPAADNAGYCASCRLLGQHPAALAGAQRTASGPVGELLDREVGLLQQRA